MLSLKVQLGMKCPKSNYVTKIIPRHFKQVCRYVCIYVCMYVGMYVSMYVCRYVCKYVCMYMYVHVCTVDRIFVVNKFLSVPYDDEN